MRQAGRLGRSFRLQHELLFASFKRHNVNDHRAATSDCPFQNARTSPLRVHRIVIPRFPRVNCRCLNYHCIVLSCREPACSLASRESSADHRAAIEHVASMKWNAASISRTRTSMSRTCTSTSRTKASAWRTCRERQRSRQCLRLKRYNVNDHRAAAIDLQAEKTARPAAPCVHRIVIQPLFGSPTSNQHVEASVRYLRYDSTLPTSVTLNGAVENLYLTIERPF